MKLASTIGGTLLGLAFLTFGLNYFFNFIPMPDDPSPATAPHKMFMGALIPTGYFAFIKIIEIIGALLVLVPKTRAVGLLFLGPIVVNILAFHGFFLKGAGLAGPPALVAVLALFVLITEWKAFAGLIKR
ncbi:MAG TPA: hypothetical protein VGE39_24155 [Prosthecobacter sp.]